MDVATRPPRSSTQPGRELLGGATRVLLAEALVLPTGLITSVFLTRQFSPEQYGRFALAATLITWIEWTITSIFARATIKAVGDAEDWRPVGTTATRVQFAIGGGVALLLCLLAKPVAMLLDEPALTSLLRLIAIQIPLFCLSRAHLHLLIGLGGYGARALASAGYWLGRLVLIVLLVTLGFSVEGALLGSIGASIIELVIARWFIRPSLTARSSFPARQLWVLAAPLFVFTVSMRLYGRLDLFALKLLDTTTAETGIYAAAQSVAGAPGFLVLAFTPLLLSTLSRTRRSGQIELAQEISRNAFRFVVILMPFVGIAAGAAPQIVLLAFGPHYASSHAVLAWLIFKTLATAMLSIAASILTAAERPDLPVAIGVSMLLLAIAGQWLLVPPFGIEGAAAATTLVAAFGAVAAVLAVYRVWHVLPPMGTLVRSTLICVAAYVVADEWSRPKPLILLQLLTMAIAVAIAFLALGEFSAGERAAVRAAVSARLRRQNTAP